MSKVPLTARGAEKLREELERLKRIERPRVIQAIEGTRARHAPGSSFGYHARTMGYVLGVVVQRGTGTSVAGVPGAEKYKTYAPGKASYHTEYWMAIDPETGIPCQEREVKQGLHGMKHPDSGDSLTFRSQTSQERLFTVKK